MKNYQVFCPSYRRADLAIAHKLFPKENFCYVVRASELDLYKKNFPDTEIAWMPDDCVTNLTDSRNYILEHFVQPGDWHIQCDDDIRAFAWLHQRKPMELSPEHLDHIIRNMFQMTADMNLHMWGMNCVEDPMAYRTSKPFHFHRVCLGPFQAFIVTDLRYDEELYLKEDYDFFLQHMNQDGRIFRANYLHYRCDHQRLKGGCQTYRTEEKELDQNKLLAKKWGSKIVHANWKSKDSINMRITV